MIHTHTHTHGLSRLAFISVNRSFWGRFSTNKQLIDRKQNIIKQNENKNRKLRVFGRIYEKKYLGARPQTCSYQFYGLDQQGNQEFLHF